MARAMHSRSDESRAGTSVSALRQRERTMRLGRFLLVASIPIFAGCAAPGLVAADAFRSAHAALRSARECGAAHDFGASTYLGLAEREMAEAHLLLGAGDAQGARGSALRARADAEVAAEIMHELNARDAARRTADEADRLEVELSTPPTPSTPLTPSKPASPAPVLGDAPEIRRVRGGGR